MRDRVLITGGAGFIGFHLAKRLEEDGSPVAVTSIERINKGVRVFNLAVGETGTFFAGKILVHNKRTPDH